MEEGICPKCNNEVAYDCITDDGLEVIGEERIVYYHVECTQCNYEGIEKYRLVFRDK